MLNRLAMVVTAKGSQPFDCSPLSFLPGDQAYQVEVDIVAAGFPGGVLGRTTWPHHLDGFLIHAQLVCLD